MPQHQKQKQKQHGLHGEACCCIAGCRLYVDGRLGGDGGSSSQRWVCFPSCEGSAGSTQLTQNACGCSSCQIMVALDMYLLSRLKTALLEARDLSTFRTHMVAAHLLPQRSLQGTTGKYALGHSNTQINDHMDIDIVFPGDWCRCTTPLSAPDHRGVKQPLIHSMNTNPCCVSAS